MSPTERSVTAEHIREVAIQLFYAKGYAATTVREIARESGIGVASLFHHYPTKMVLLETVIHSAMDGLLDATDRAYRDADPSPQERLRAIVRAHVLFAIHRGPEGTVGSNELRSLEGPGREAVIAKRDRQQRTFDDVVEDGIRRGVFHAKYPREVSRSIAILNTMVTSWYRPGRQLTPEEIANVYADLALLMVEYRPEGAELALPKTLVAKQSR
jgi:AcrR family transcriptional regulator